MTVPPTAHVACVLLAPWGLTLLQRAHPGVPVTTLSEGTRRVVYVSPEAAESGVQPGMRDTAALSRCPELHAEVVTAPEASAAWNEVLEALYARYSDRIEGRHQGVVFLSLQAPAARELATALYAPVGLATSRELAHLAALRAAPGDLCEVGSAEDAFLKRTPLAHLGVLGLTPAHLERLTFLGLHDLGGLMAWSPAQREAFLGVDVGSRINRFLKGDRTTGIETYRPGQTLEASLAPDAPLLEPEEAHAALSDLLPGLWTALRGRTCAYLTIHAETLGGTLSATRRLKWPLDQAALTRIAELSLTDTGALPLGIDRLTVSLSGLRQPARLVGLWAGLAELQVTQDVLDRFPEALVKVQWLDPYAYATDAQYAWVDWLTGRVRATPMMPRRSRHATRSETHARAVQRLLAFFEGSGS
ncbi:Y-family DNA polymerase [Deinococcus yunweiensis]|uniref:Y-family DNA polymerase n=1 Tax=Deinococcus yunweiensis TaxID=367282 RepID=UPI00398F8825